jgi:guanylate kinase
VLMTLVSRKGFMIALSSPSGAGKTSIARGILERDSNVRLSVSFTTRPKRPGETDELDYHFVSRETFETMIRNDSFLEYAEVFGNMYGTPKTVVYEQLNEGKDVIFDIDWQGTQQIAQNAPEDLIRVFILPPSYKALEERLRKRAQDSQEVIEQRMSSAFAEISHWAEYDYIVINNDFNHSLDQVYSILVSERLKRRRQIGLVDFVKSLHESQL